MREIDERCKRCINYHPHPWCRIFGTSIHWTSVNECRDCEFIREEMGILKTHNGRADQFKPMLSESEKRKAISTVLQILEDDEKSVEQIKLSGERVKFLEYNRLEKTQNG